MASKRVNTACHFCDHAAQRAGRTAVALQVACSTPDCRKVFCSRPACRRKLPKKLSVQTREEFEAFKFRVDRGEVVFICQHCEDQSSCPGPQCQKRWKNRLARISKKGSTRSGSVGEDSPGGIPLTRQLSGDSAMSLDSLASGVNMIQQQQQALRYPPALPVGMKLNGCKNSKSISLTREDLNDNLERGDTLVSSFDISHPIALASEDDFIGESVFPPRNVNGHPSGVWDSYLHANTQFGVQQVDGHGISVKQMDASNIQGLSLPQNPPGGQMFPSHPLAYQHYGMEFNRNLLPPHMLRHSGLTPIMEMSGHENSGSQQQNWNRIPDESVFITDEVLHEGFQFGHFMDPNNTSFPGFCPPPPIPISTQQHAAGKMSTADVKPSHADLEHGEKLSQERFSGGFGATLGSFDSFVSRSHPFVEAPSSNLIAGSSSSSSKTPRPEQPNQRSSQHNSSENSGRTEEDLESVHSLHDIVLPHVDHEPFPEVILSDLIRKPPTFFAGTEI